MCSNATKENMLAVRSMRHPITHIGSSLQLVDIFGSGASKSQEILCISLAEIITYSTRTMQMN